MEAIDYGHKIAKKRFQQNYSLEMEKSRGIYLGNIKCTSDFSFVGSFLTIVSYKYVRGGIYEETSTKNVESVYCR